MYQVLKTKKIEVRYFYDMFLKYKILIKHFIEYIREARIAMNELLELLKPDTWIFEKTYS